MFQNNGGRKETLSEREDRRELGGEGKKEKNPQSPLPFFYLLTLPLPAPLTPATQASVLMETWLKIQGASTSFLRWLNTVLAVCEYI